MTVFSYAKMFCYTGSMKKKHRTLRSDPTFKLALLLFIAGLFVNYVLFYAELAPEQATHDTGSVLGRSYPLPQADISSGDGGTITVENITAIISEETFSSDIYMRVDRTVRGNPISVDNLWQVSDFWNVRIRHMANDNEVSTHDTKKNYILAFPYTQNHLTSDQGVRFDENYLKLVRGETLTGPWEVLHATTVDTVNRTASTITNRGGYYTIMGGTYSPGAVAKNISIPSNVQQETQAKGIVLKDNEVIVTITPTPEPTITNIATAAAILDKEPAVASMPIKEDNFFTAVFGFLQSFLQ